MFINYRYYREELGFSTYRDRQDIEALKSKFSKLKGLKVSLKNKIYRALKKIDLQNNFKTTVTIIKDAVHEAIVIVEKNFGKIVVTILIVAAGFFGPIESSDLNPKFENFNSSATAQIEQVRSLKKSENLEVNEISEHPSPRKDFILKWRGGDSESDAKEIAKLKKSMITKTPQNLEPESISINKFLKKVGNFVGSVITNPKTWRLGQVAANPVQPDFPIAESTPRTVLSSQDKKTKSSSFAESYTPSYIYCNYYHNDGSKLSCG